MASHPRPQSREDFEIAVVCALPLEYDAVALAFDEFWDEDGDQLGKAARDPNTYTTGRIGSHNVVLALLSSMGKVSAAGAVTALRSSYTQVKLAFITGICGGVPAPSNGVELVLGDVIISKAIIQYDLGRQYPGKFARKDTIDDNLGRPNQEIRSLLAVCQTQRGRAQLMRKVSDVLADIQNNALDSGYETDYARPAVTEDLLFEPNYLHLHQNTGSGCGCGNSGACDVATKASCEELQCDHEHTVKRNRLDVSRMQSSRIFIGDVASGDTVMKSGEHRDRIARELGVMAFEMEGAGVWDQIPCILIKGVCDYADSHKNKKWQPYAAATAASATKALLHRYTQTDRPKRSHSDDIDPTHALGHRIVNNGAGHQYTHTGDGNQNINTGSGKQFNAGTIYFQP
ncbi:hypothetical protein EsH8_IV_001236 [Colletotrichum jinshuiense]